MGEIKYTGQLFVHTSSFGGTQHVKGPLGADSTCSLHLRLVVIGQTEADSPRQPGVVVRPLFIILAV